MKIFEYALHHPQEVLAITDDGEKIKYEELNRLAEEMSRKVGHRLVFVLCRNTPGSLLGYLALLQSGGVPLLLDAEIAPPLLADLVQRYCPAFCLVPDDLEQQTLKACILVRDWSTPLNNSDTIKGNSTLKEKRTIKENAANVNAENEETAVECAAGTAAEIVLSIRDYCLRRCAPEGQDPPLAPELRLLLTTSGSTGSSKLVRISAENLDANAASIVEYLQIKKEDRPITVLPMQYSYGMSILHTHIMAGAPIILTRYTLMERGFWERMQKDRVTSLCGVPYTFDMYARLGLMQMDLPDLRVITQAGGKLSEKRQLQFANWAAEKGIRFYVMYGQTEASPRMGWLPPGKAVEKCGSMGIAIPGGKLDLLVENESVRTVPGDSFSQEEARRNSIVHQHPANIETIEAQDRVSAAHSTGAESPVGELVYTGPNVALGYAICAEDLSKGDEFHGVLHTGDMARRDADGYFYIVGRRSRFIKMAGRRVGLDEVEKLLRAQYPDLDIACAGDDDALYVYVADEEEKTEIRDINAVEEGKNKAHDRSGRENKDAAQEQLAERISAFAEEMTGVPQRWVKVSFIPEIPRSSSGKIHYEELR